MESEVCFYNKTGFCKFRDSCVKRHENQSCEDESCNGSTCSKRHPKICKYFKIYKRCKFGSYCMFSHEDKISNEYEKRIMNLEEIISKCQEEMSNLKSKIEEMELLLKKSTSVDVNTETENFEKNVKEEGLIGKCEVCEKSFKSTKGLKAHMRVHDKISQVDGNISLVLSDEDLDSTLEKANQDGDDHVNTDNIDVADDVEVDHVKNDLVDKILLSNARSSILTRVKADDVEIDLARRLENIGAKVISFKYFNDHFGDFKSGVAEITPVNLQLVWGRRLNVENVSIIQYIPQF